MSSFWILLKQRMMEVVSGDNWSYKTCKLQSNHHHQQTSTQSSAYLIRVNDEEEYME